MHVQDAMTVLVMSFGQTTNQHSLKPSMSQRFFALLLCCRCFPTVKRFRSLLTLFYVVIKTQCDKNTSPLVAHIAVNISGSIKTLQRLVSRVFQGYISFSTSAENLTAYISMKLKIKGRGVVRLAFQLGLLVSRHYCCLQAWGKPSNDVK